MAARNKNLGNAKKAKKDEFYTQRVDIENELCHYADHFRDKVVYCNCDDPVTSEFWQFFVRNFKPWGLKRLIATHYEPDAANYSYSLEITEDTNGDGYIDIHDEPTVKQLPCNGDFRSAACIELLQQSDIVVTNPPFSLFREYVAQLMEYNKKFIIIGNQIAITYKEIFPLLKDNKMWLGYGFDGNIGFFSAPYEDYAVSSNHREGLIRVSGVMWFTNLDIPKRHQTLDMRGNYYRGNEEKYPHYDNYDAIEVSKTTEVPGDYYGVMGVPITFMNKYCPEQFEILGMTASADTMDKPVQLGEDFIQVYRSQGGTGHFSANMYGVCYYDQDGKAKVPYGRILIRRKDKKEGED